MKDSKKEHKEQLVSPLKGGSLKNSIYPTGDLVPARKAAAILPAWGVEAIEIGVGLIVIYFVLFKFRNRNDSSKRSSKESS